MRRLIGQNDSVIDNPDACYAICLAKDSRFDGVIYVCVTSTKIYCRPSCPAIVPRRENLRFHRTAAASQHAGFRACKRCRPDATPGSPEWNSRADTVGRAMRMIADGVVDRGGVDALATALGYSERHVLRLLEGELGVGPVALARAQRAQSARVLIETTAMTFTDITWAAGFSSIRQFNDTIREVFALTPTDMRAKAKLSPAAASSTLRIRLAYRPPFNAAQIFGFLGFRAIPGMETFDVTTLRYQRALRLNHGNAIVTLSPILTNAIDCELSLEDVRDMQMAVHRCRLLLDLDADPVAIADDLRRHEPLKTLVDSRPGLRSPGAVDGHELAVRALLGQQISVTAARTHGARLAAALGTPLGALATDRIAHTFPTAAAIAEAPDELLAMPASRRNALRGLCHTLAEGAIDLSPGADRRRSYDQLVALAGIGPWTANYIVMRALSDPDLFLETDLGVQHGLAKLGLATKPRDAARLAAGWAPWRSYVVHYLWESLT